jgi:hypothetical protein
MRRVQVIDDGVWHCDEADCSGVVISKRDYRLMLAVIREVDLYDKLRSGWPDIRHALDAFNAPPRKRK